MTASGNGAGVWFKLQLTLDVREFERSGGYENIEPVEVKTA